MVDKFFQLIYLIGKFNMRLDGAPQGANRETGENPVRSRRCDRGQNPLIATGLSINRSGR
jgi:hypothetical protein